MRLTLTDSIVAAASTGDAPPTLATAYAQGLGLLTEKKGRYVLTPAGRRFAARLARKSPRRHFA